jgi:hypothetical protein
MIGRSLLAGVVDDSEVVEVLQRRNMCTIFENVMLMTALPRVAAAAAWRLLKVRMTVGPTSMLDPGCRSIVGPDQSDRRTSPVRHDVSGYTSEH